MTDNLNAWLNAVEAEYRSDPLWADNEIDDLLEWTELRFRAGKNADSAVAEVDQWIDTFVEAYFG